MGKLFYFRSRDLPIAEHTATEPTRAWLPHAVCESAVDAAAHCTDNARVARRVLPRGLSHRRNFCHLTTAAKGPDLPSNLSPLRFLPWA